MIKKSKLFFHQIWWLIKGYKIRTLLTFGGLSLGIYIFSLGAVCMDGYYEGMMQEIRQMPKNSMFLKVEDCEVKDLKNLFSIGTDYFDMGVIHSSYGMVLETETSDNDLLSVYSNVIGITSMAESSLTITKDDEMKLVKMDLVKGRLLDERDNNSAELKVVIDEYAEDILFKGEDAIGKKVRILEDESEADQEDEKIDSIMGKEFEVVGVVRNNYYTRERENEFLKDIEKKRKKGILSTSINVYCPYNALNDMEKQSGDMFFIWSEMEAATKIDVEKKVNLYIENHKDQFDFSEVVDKELEEEWLNVELKPYRNMMKILSFVFLVISGINNMEIMFFSVKERIQEIGIRKAFGASSYDIVLQLVLENVFIAMFSATFAVAFSYITAWGLENYILNELGLKFYILVSKKNIILPFSIGILHSIFCSFVPSVYGAKLKVTNALKFE